MVMQVIADMGVCEWTLEELCACACCGCAVNSYYLNLDETKWIVLNSKQQDMDGEVWKVCPHNDGFMASNYGRIKCDGRVAALKESRGDAAGQLPSQDLLNKYPSLVGYLKAAGKAVHQLVADAWLDARPDGYTEIHHISNDGYDNRPQNLIYLTKEEHNEITKWVVKKCEYKPEFPWNKRGQ